MSRCTGEYDRLATAGAAAALARDLGADTYTIAGAAHTPMLESRRSSSACCGDSNWRPKMTAVNRQATDVSTVGTGGPGAAGAAGTESRVPDLDRLRSRRSAVLAIGLVYLVLEFIHTGQIVDSLFVSMLVGATLILLIGMRSVLNFLATRGETFYAFVLATADPEEAYRRHAHLFATVTSTPRMTLSGVLYGFLLGSAPVPARRVAGGCHPATGPCGVHVWRELTTGVASTRFSASSPSRRRWAAGSGRPLAGEQPFHGFLTGATRRISVLASGYVAICLSSVLFSVLPLQGSVLAYSVFAAFMLVLSILVRPCPGRKIHDAKFAALFASWTEKVQAAFFRWCYC